MLILKLLYEQQSLSSILQTSFLTFFDFFLSPENGRELNIIFGYSTSTSRKYPLSLIWS